MVDSKLSNPPFLILAGDWLGRMDARFSQQEKYLHIQSSLDGLVDFLNLQSDRLCCPRTARDLVGLIFLSSYFQTTITSKSTIGEASSRFFPHNDLTR